MSNQRFSPEFKDEAVRQAVQAHIAGLDIGFMNKVG